MFKTLLKFELKKICGNKIAIIAFFIMVVTSLVMGLNEEGAGLNRNTAKKSNERDALNGRLLDDRLFSELADKSKDEYGLTWNSKDSAYEDVAAVVINTVGENIPLKTIDEETYYEKRQTSIDEAMNLSKLTDSEKVFWQKKGAQVSIPFTVYNVNAPVAITNGFSNFSTIMMFFIAVCLSGIFAGEYRNKTNEIIRGTKNGRMKLFSAKLIASLIFSIGSLAISTVVFMLTTILAWGTEGFDGQVQLECPFAEIQMTEWGLVKLILILLFTATVLYTITIFFLSQFTRNEVASMGILMGINFLLFAVSMFLPSRLRILSHLFSMVPMSFISPRMLYEYRLIGFNHHFFMTWQFVPVLYIGISVVLLILCVWHNCKLYKS